MSELFDAEDLFAPPPPRRRPVSARAAALPPFVPAGTVASFSCRCGARDEVLEPAPALVDCWSCRSALSMSRWTPRDAPPLTAARLLTLAERARIV